MPSEILRVSIFLSYLGKFYVARNSLFSKVTKYFSWTYTLEFWAENFSQYSPLKVEEHNVPSEFWSSAWFMRKSWVSILKKPDCRIVQLKNLYINKTVEVFSFVTIYRLNCWTYLDKWYLIRTGLTCRWFFFIENFRTYRNGVTRDANVSKIIKKCNYLGNYMSNRNSESTLFYPTFNFGFRGVEPPWR